MKILKNRLTKNSKIIYIRCLIHYPKFLKILIIWRCLDQRVIQQLFLLINISKIKESIEILKKNYNKNL